MKEGQQEFGRNTDEEENFGYIFRMNFQKSLWIFEIEVSGTKLLLNELREKPSASQKNYSKDRVQRRSRSLRKGQVSR